MDLKKQVKVILKSLLIMSLMISGINYSSGQGKNEEVTIIAPYIPSIGDANKMPFKPEVTQQSQDTAHFEYDYLTKPLQVQIDPQPVEPLKYSEGDKKDLYRNFAKVGIGNYYTPYLDFMASSVSSEKLLFGVRLKHLSSQGRIKNYPTSAYSHNTVAVFGKAFSKTHTLSADIGYYRDVVHCYGFIPDSFPDVEYTKEELKQRFQHIRGIVEFSSNYKEKNKLDHLFRFGVHHFSDYYGTKETEIDFLTRLEKSFKAGRSDFNHAAALDFGLVFLGYRDSISSSNPFFINLKPVYKLNFGQYRFQAGLDINMASTDSPSGSTIGIDVFPFLKGEVIVVESQVSAFAEIAGERKINTFRGFAELNPFIVSTPEVAYTDEQFRIGGGITGNSGGFNFLARADFSHINDMPLFVTDTSSFFRNKFDVIYDDLNLLKIQAGMGYMKTDQVTARLLATYFYYSGGSELRAWHMPDFEIDLDAGYTFMEKYTARISLLALGSKYAPVYQDGEFVSSKISGALDLGAGFDYEISHMLSAFVDVNNILNQHYQRWYDYPVQGILAMAGVKLSF